MIERLQRIATVLARFRLPIFVLAGFSLSVLVLSLLDNPWLNSDELLMPSILGVCWALMMYSTGEIFQTLPREAGRDATLRRRLSAGVGRLLYWALGILTVLSTLALLVLSYQILRVWL